jgi:hypothetical protein
VLPVWLFEIQVTVMLILVATHSEVHVVLGHACCDYKFKSWFGHGCLDFSCLAVGSSLMQGVSTRIISELAAGQTGTEGLSMKD